jgi:hypothetical protein
VGSQKLKASFLQMQISCRNILRSSVRLAGNDTKTVCGTARSATKLPLKGLPHDGSASV